MLLFNIAMFSVVIYFITIFIKISNTVTDKPDGGKTIRHKIELLRRPNLLHLFVFGLFVTLLYWMFI